MTPRGCAAPGEVARVERCIPPEPVGLIVQCRQSGFVHRTADVAREIQVRSAPVIQQSAQLVHVVHHAQIRGLAVLLERLAAVPALGVVSEFVHQRGRLHERRAHGLAVEVVEAAQRDHDVGAGEVGDAGVGARLVERRVGHAGGARPVHIVGRHAVHQTRLLGFRQANGMREERVVEDVGAVAVEAPLAGGARRITRVGLGHGRRRVQHLVADEPEPRLPTNRAGILRELAHPRRVGGARHALGDRFVEGLAAARHAARHEIRLGILGRIEGVAVRIDRADVEVHVDPAGGRGGEGVAHQLQRLVARHVRVAEPRHAAVRHRVGHAVVVDVIGLHVADFDEHVLHVLVGAHRREIRQRAPVRVEDGIR